MLLSETVHRHLYNSSQDSDGEKSDDNLVVDVSNEVSGLCCLLSFGCQVFADEITSVCLHQEQTSPRGTPLPSPRENGLDKARLLKKDPCSPASTASSASSSSLKSKELAMVKTVESCVVAHTG